MLYADVGKEIKCDVCGIDLSLRIEKALPLALIINELVSNSLMLAFPERPEGTVGLFFVRLHDGFVSMTISDNGVGFDWSATNNDSFGFEMINALVDQLGGSISVESNASGTRVIVQFPAD